MILLITIGFIILGALRPQIFREFLQHLKIFLNRAFELFKKIIRFLHWFLLQFLLSLKDFFTVWVERIKRGY